MSTSDGMLNSYRPREIEREIEREVEIGRLETIEGALHAYSSGLYSQSVSLVSMLR